MATSDQGFRDFLPRLTPTSTETAAARSHRASIESCLENTFSIEDLPPELLGAESLSSTLNADSTRIMTLSEARRNADTSVIREALEYCKGDRSQRRRDLRYILNHLIQSNEKV
jgi:hypothetical protein